ncbi:MAG: TonB-dependent receptor [Pseudomonadota bacterium]
MKEKSILRKSVLLALATPALVSLPQVSFAQEEQVEEIEEIITTGTRRAERTASDSPVPIDVIGGNEFRQNSSTDVQDLLRSSVPSFDVNTQPISDAATIVRPANVRGLSPDNVLVLVNGKRRHRGSIISFLGGGIADGAQGVDISAIPSLALKQVEVLRDGASSQYGSDAIAGVLNFVLRDDAEGAQVVAQYGSTTEGDGDNYNIAANIGLPLGDSGFINLTGEIRDVEGTVRSVVRQDVLDGIAGGYQPVADFQAINTYTSEAPQYWGQPDVEDDIKLFFNSAIELSSNAELYAFGNYGERTVTGGFFYRNVVGPNRSSQRAGVYRGPLVDATGNVNADPLLNTFNSVLVGDLDGLGTGGACVAGIPLDGVIPDPTILADVTADANCFSFIETIPAGFVPRFGGDNEDFSFAAGIRGDFDIGTGLMYDFSVVTGSNRTDFFIRNTINASLGPNTPRDFVPGGQEQSETTFNASFVYGIDVGFASDLNVAFGAEYREETFDLFAGDDASFALGPLADQGFSSSSNGFGGFPNSSSNSQDSTAFYVDLEADITDRFTAQAAVRFEDFSEFGDTTDFKLAGILDVTDTFSIRAGVSTGFHAPTAGQANITNVTTQNVAGVLVDQGTLPLNTAAGQLAADFIDATNGAAGRPELGPEEATNFSIGVAFDLGNTSWTIDYYNIELEDRVALGANVDFLDALNFVDPNGNNYTSVGLALAGLDADGVIDRQDFLGLDDLSQFRFFSNSFSTTTTGFDIVGNTDFELGAGSSSITLAFNINDTEVDDIGEINPISDSRVAAIEDLLPNVKGNVSWTHLQGDFRTLVRLNYYGEWQDTGNGLGPEFEIDAEFLIDTEVAYMYNDNIELILGIANLFDTYPQENPSAGSLGQLYSEASPFGFNGTEWYLRGRFNF